jgi:hypothetical protein
VLTWLENTQYAAFIRGDSLWGLPLALTIHAFGTALVVGFTFIISLRLLGWFETIPYTSLNRLFPVLWAAIVLQFLSGIPLWMTKPTRYVDDVAFMLKFVFVIIGIVLAVYSYGMIKREAASWEAKGVVSSREAQFAAASLLVWSIVLIAGRLTAYLGSIG